MKERAHCGSCGYFLSENWDLSTTERESSKPMGKRAIAKIVLEDYWLTCPACKKRYYCGERQARIIELQI